MLLLSATPHQGMQDKFISLLELLKPERKRDLGLLAIKPELLQDMVIRNYKADVTDAQGNFVFHGKVYRGYRSSGEIHKRLNLIKRCKIIYVKAIKLGRIKGNRVMRFVS